MAKDKLQKLADELELTMDKRASIEQEFSEALDPVKEYEEQLREQILKQLQLKGYKFVKATSGLGFGITRGKTSFLIKKGCEQEALEWAKREYPSLLTISKPDLAKVLKPMLKRPEFFEEKVGEPHLTVNSTEDEAILMPKK